jgi:proteasome lid subunit RPN8/RPN11
MFSGGLLTLVGTVHSHPSGNINPSDTRLKLFLEQHRSGQIKYDGWSAKISGQEHCWAWRERWRHAAASGYLFQITDEPL